MKKVFRRLLALSLLLAIVASTAACNCFGNRDGSELRIAVVKLGYGTDWLTALEEAFEEKTGEKVKVEVKVGSSGESSFKTAIDSKSTPIDLFFTKRGWFYQDVYKGNISVKGKTYSCLYADLTDVWDSYAAEGETKTIKEKMDPLYVDALALDGKYYNLPWAGGVYGIVRNTKVWDNLHLTDADVPYTTDELFALCDRVKASTAPFIYCMTDEYYTGWSPIFFAQYEGVENAKQFMEGKDINGQVSANVYTYQGHTEAMKVIDRLLDPQNGYQHGASKEGLDFTTIQGRFLSNDALFMVNGSWLENEMSANYAGASGNVDFIRTPVISAIVDKLSFKSNNATADDAKLKEVIKYVDAVDAGETPEKPAGVSDADIQKVTEARHYSYMASGVDHRAYVPAYSNNVDLAKQFLKFMYSDEGLNIYYKTLKGTMLPALPTTGSYDSTGLTLSKFRQSSNGAQQSGFVFDREPKARLFVLNQISNCYQVNNLKPVDQFASTNGETADEVMSSIKSYLRTKWSSFEL